ncbi:Meckelin, partial [Cladochytrium tenue]
MADRLDNAQQHAILALPGRQTVSRQPTLTRLAGRLLLAALAVASAFPAPLPAAAAAGDYLYPILSSQVGQTAALQASCASGQVWDIAELYCRTCATNQSVTAVLVPPLVAVSSEASAIGPSGLSSPVTNFPSDFFAEYFQFASSLCQNSGKLAIVLATFSADDILDSTGALYPIPVNVLNLAGNTLNSYTGNTFTHRFFIIDNLSGISNGTLSVIRFPTLISISVQKSNQGTGAIYTPVMSIQYAERSVAGSITSTAVSAYASPTYAFLVTYSMDLTEFWKTVQTLFAFSTTLALVLGLYFGRNWSRRSVASAAEAIDLQAQATLFLVLPNGSFDMYNYNAVLNTAIVTKVSDSVGLFFFDWEKPKGGSVIQENGKLYQAPVSIWRTIFMANQWCALQRRLTLCKTYRKVSVTLLLICVTFFLEGLGVKYASTYQPNIKDLSQGSRSPVLIFAIDALIFALFIVIQLLFRYFLYDRFYRNRILQFVDLLSVANISLLIFNEKCHGYYIHGRSVHTTADTDIGSLNENLQREGNDLVPARGLQDTDQQSFEVFVTQSFKSAYDKIYSLIHNERTQGSSMASKLKHLATLKSAVSTQLNDQSNKAYRTVNKFLCTFMEKNLKEFPYSTRQKTYVEKILGAVPELMHGSVLLH